ncbi:hypothetical protein LJB42_001524 [Komagataella kurtzmanii]|nr:hypothetical protein LJB42_001524 [Komagataella kurtzmanii]
MRFGLPADFYEDDANEEDHQALVSNEKIRKDISDLLGQLQIDSVKKFPPPISIMEETVHLPELKNPDYNSETEESAESDTSETQSLNAYFDSIQDYVERSLKQKISQQRESVNNVLLKLEEEKRKKEAERKAKEEAERLRKEEEQRNQRILAEQKKKKEEEERKRREEEQKVKEKAEKLLKEKREAELKAKEREEAEKGFGITNFSDVAKQFVSYKKQIEQIKKEIVEGLKKPENSELKKQVNQLKRKINPKFGQLNNSTSQLQKITREVLQLVGEALNLGELGLKWILNFMAKAIVSQAETEVTVSPRAATPLANLAVSLMTEIPDFKTYLMARFVKKCPLIIGYTCKIDTEDGRIRMGWKRNSDGKWEDETRYNERLGGIAMVYFVITQLRVEPDLVPISESWKFLARMLNTPLELLSNVHFLVTSNWWDACAIEFVNTYGEQAKKLMNLVWDDWTASVSDKKFSGAARLRLLGEDYVNGSIEGLAEMNN